MAEPELARPDANTLELLGALATRLRQLVLLSGRDSEQLAERVPIGGVRLIGNHGLEEWVAGGARLSQSAEPFAGNLASAADRITGLAAADTGVRVERKRVSISVHFRQGKLFDRAQLEAALRPIAEREGLRLHEGRFVWELRPPLDINKGSAIVALSRSLQPRALIYAGDDITDADAFAALRQLQGIRTIGIGVISSEVRAVTFEHCDLLVDGVEGVKRFLAELLAIG